MARTVEPNPTVALETKKVLRDSVVSASIAKIENNSIRLNTIARRTGKGNISSGDSAMFDQQKLARHGEEIAGKIQIDILSDVIIRVRYAQTDQVLDNITPMVVGSPKLPEICKIFQGEGFIDVGTVADGTTLCPRLTVVTASIEMVINLNPYRIVINDLNSNRICGIGGPEKNYFNPWDSFNTGLSHTADSKTIATESFDLLPGEAIYGLGETFNGLNKRGQTIELNMIDALGTMSPRGYKNIPFYISNSGYGVFFNHSSIMNFWVGSASAADVQIGIEDDFLDYYLFFGNIKEVLSSYTDITGKGAMPPEWSFGYWQSKISYQSAEEVMDIAKKLRANEVPCDVIHLDTFWFQRDWYCDLKFSKERFPNPKAFMDELAEMGFKISLWQLPYIPEGSDLFDELEAVDGFVKNAAGEIHSTTGICFTPGFKGRIGIIDFTNPKAIVVYQKFLSELFRLGVKVIKTDFGEAAPVDGVYFNGTPGHQNHNLYPLLYNKAAAEVTEKETGDAVVWARSAWAGSQRYPIHWGGDNSPNYFNLLSQLEGGLSFGMSGFQFWSQDIGGFLGNTNDRLLTRWMQVGMFLSHSRIHGSGDRELYKFSKETQRICKKYIQLRYRLMPYIIAQSLKCVESSLPMARPLVVEFQDDPNTFNISDQYLFGDELLVAPILTAGDSRRVYLPKGKWTNWWDKTSVSGPIWIEVEADLETMPLYVREGGMVPLGPLMNYVGEKKCDKLDVYIAPFEGDGESLLKLRINGEEVLLTYTSQGEIHKLQSNATGVRIEVNSLSDVCIQC